jgi:tRNA nucleotidyltransferase (CCA-adding enzyme)
LYTARVKRPPKHPRFAPGHDVPSAIRAIVALLTARGHAAYLVGGCVRDLLTGESTGDFDIATSASPEQVLELLPLAIPIGLRHGTVMVPTGDGPVDITSFRAGPDIEADLGHRDFSINAMAFDPKEGVLIDPYGGRNDVADRLLRAVGSAEDRFREDPLRILRAARLVATLELTVAPEIEGAMAKLRAGLRGVAGERVHSEIERMLLAPNAARGLELLRRTRIEADLAPGTAPDAVAVVGALPPDRDLRLAGWLRGTNAEGILRRLRFPRRTAQHVAHLLWHHPIGADLNPKRDAAVRKLIKSAGEKNLAALCTLREVEIGVAEDAVAAAATLDQLRSVRAAIARVRQAGALALRRLDLAIDGREVMAVLGCGPGRSVGQALRHLTDRVIEDPALNTPEHLRSLLERWASDRRDP